MWAWVCTIVTLWAEVRACFTPWELVAALGWIWVAGTMSDIYAALLVAQGASLPVALGVGWCAGASTMTPMLFYAGVRAVFERGQWPCGMGTYC